MSVLERRQAAPKGGEGGGCFLLQLSLRPNNKATLASAWGKASHDFSAGRELHKNDGKKKKVKNEQEQRRGKTYAFYCLPYFKHCNPLDK